MRTADAVGARVWTTGITPHPITNNDTRPAHVADRAQHLIAKTALGAELTVEHRHFASIEDAIASARHSGYQIVALEQNETAVNIFSFHARLPIALVLGPEVQGLSSSQLDLCDATVEIPMHGTKESLNVAVAAGIALYQLSPVQA